MEKARCQRIGCNAMFTEDDNPDGSCTYHHSGPLFHDGMKEWSCCKQRSHDFSLFLEIPGCKSGKHTTEKPVLAKVAPKPQKPAVSAPTFGNIVASSESCQRCRQGFFCADHGSHARDINPKTSTAVSRTSSESDSNSAEVPLPQVIPQVKRIVDINEPQTCKRKGCGITFKEIDNHDTACSYHPGPAVFHDRLRGWKCCDVHVKEFDEFMSIPPCAKGWHDANPEPQ